MNVLLSNRCNRRCAYCFAQERIAYPRSQEREAPLFISEEDFRTVVAFARRSGLRDLGVLGGEPSLHPQFVELLSHAWREGLRTKVFTNGLWREDEIAAMEELGPAQRAKMHAVLNVNGAAHTPPAEQKAQEALLGRLGRLCSLSYNVSRLDFDPSFLVDLILEYDAEPSIRLGIAEPLARLEAEHVPISEYRKLAPTLLELADNCDRHDIRLGFDCGWILCMFTPEEVGRLSFAGARFQSSCGPAIDVGTDLSAWSCFPLSTFCPGTRLTEFKDLDALVRHFKGELEPLFRAGALPECAACRHRQRRRCTGGCAAHVYRSLNP